MEQSKTQVLVQRNERSRIIGDYYRDLSLNYYHYHQSRKWPDPPFPVGEHAVVDSLQ